MCCERNKERTMMMILFVISVFLCFGCISATTIVLSPPPGNYYVKSNFQVLCTDDVEKPIQPEWTSPSRPTNKIDKYLAPDIDAATCNPVPQSCNDALGDYCSNAFASCASERCLCKKFGYNQCSCLVSLGDCQMERNTNNSFGKSTIAFAKDGNTNMEYTRCESNELTRSEIHIIAMQYGVISPDFTDVNVNIVRQNNSSDKKIILVLVSNRLVYWRVNLQNNETIHRLVHLCRYQDEDNLKIIGGTFTEIHKPKDAPSGIGYDEQYGGNTVDMLLYLQEKYGHVSSFTSTFTAAAWNITIDLNTRNDSPKQHSTVSFTETPLPWETKLTIMDLQNDQDYGAYRCSGKNTQSEITIIKMEPVVINVKQIQKLDYSSNGKIHCEVKGLPEPDVIWSFKGKEISVPSNKYIVNEKNLSRYLEIWKVNENDEGEYQCKGIQSETGDNRIQTIQVLINHEKPTAPTISFVNVTETSVDIRITSSILVDKYFGLKYVLNTTSKLEVQIEVVKQDMIIEITDLSPSTNYTVYAFAISEGGKSNISNEIQFETKSPIPTTEESHPTTYTTDRTFTMPRKTHSSVSRDYNTSTSPTKPLRIIIEGIPGISKKNCLVIFFSSVVSIGPNSILFVYLYYWYKKHTQKISEVPKDEAESVAMETATNDNT